MAGLVCGVDIGGTFTDCFVAWDNRYVESKALTTHHNLAVGFNEALRGASDELGVSERDLTDLEYAALMHDIGQLSLSEPIPGGATTMVAPVHQRRIAELGAEVIRQTGVLDRVADIVERQADPYRPHRGQLDTDLPIESRIIKAVNAYDDLVGASLESDRKLQAVERLQLGIDREFDPTVVDTLARIVERQTEYAY